MSYSINHHSSRHRSCSFLASSFLFYLVGNQIVIGVCSLKSDGGATIINYYFLTRVHTIIQKIILIQEHPEAQEIQFGPVACIFCVVVSWHCTNLRWEVLRSPLRS